MTWSGSGSSIRLLDHLTINQDLLILISTERQSLFAITFINSRSGNNKKTLKEQKKFFSKIRKK
jgi:hypothetical protein